jgi:hypothetical protein
VFVYEFLIKLLFEFPKIKKKTAKEEEEEKCGTQCGLIASPQLAIVVLESREPWHFPLLLHTATVHLETN